MDNFYSSPTLFKKLENKHIGACGTVKFNREGMPKELNVFLREGIPDSIVDIPGYTIIRRDRQTDSHGGVCLYNRNNNNLNYQLLDDVKCCDEHEILWVHMKPNRVPRDFSCLVVAVVNTQNNPWLKTTV